MTGASKRYRTVDRDRADLAGHEGAPITQPSLFVGGALDASLAWPADAIEACPETLPGLLGAHVLDGCGHFGQQARPGGDGPRPDRLARRPAQLNPASPAPVFGLSVIRGSPAGTADRPARDQHRSQEIPVRIIDAPRAPP